MLKRQSCLPVRTSNARTSPLVLLCVETVAPSRNDEPTMTMSPTTAGRGMDADFAGLEIDLLVDALDDADLQIEHAVRCANDGIIAPVLASSSTS